MTDSNEEKIKRTIWINTLHKFTDGMPKEWVALPIAKKEINKETEWIQVFDINGSIVSILVADTREGKNEVAI